MSPVELFFGFIETCRLEIRDAKVRIGERIVRRELCELLELGFSLSELVSLEVAERKHSRRIEVFDRRPLLPTGRARGDHRGTKENRPRAARSHGYFLSRGI